MFQTNKSNSETKRKKGRTRPEIIKRHLLSKEGQTLNEKTINHDIESVYSMGIYKHVSLERSVVTTSESTETQVDLTLNIMETKTGGLSMGLGISPMKLNNGCIQTLVGNISYSEDNLFGLDQKLILALEISRGEINYKVQHTDPWVGSGCLRISRSISVTKSKSKFKQPCLNNLENSNHFRSIKQKNIKNLLIDRDQGKLELIKHINRKWTTILGLKLQKTNSSNDNSLPHPKDNHDDFNNILDKGEYWTMVTSIRTTFNNIHPYSTFFAALEKTNSLPSLFFDQCHGPNFLRFHSTLEQKIQIHNYQVLMSFRGGTLNGDLLPYEAFTIGGNNSVRGYNDASLNISRHCAVFKADFNWPIDSPMMGTIFIDLGSDLSSENKVSGNSSNRFDHFGTGWGIGCGIRLESPFGPLSLEYAFNDQARGMFHFGVKTF
jgi:outer membrane protein insertion porin family